MIDHIFYENNEKKLVRSVYAHLHELKTHAGDIVSRRQIIASVGQDPDKLFAPHLHLEFRWDQSLSPTYWPSANGKDLIWMKDHYADPTQFITGHRSTLVPQHEPTLLLVDQSSYKLRVVRNG